MEHLSLCVLGFAVVGVVCFDVFHTAIIPRLTLRRARIAPVLIGNVLWPSYRRLIKLLPSDWRTGWLEVFAPGAFVILLATWLCCIIAGFALVFYSFRNFIRPPIADLPEAAYFAGTSVLTLGFGDVVAAAWPARAVVLLAAVLGLMFMALTVSLLFSMLTYLQERERVVNTIMSRAGLPPSGVVLLMRYRELGIVGSMSSAFVSWETWLASILESHRAYPLLMYFRSTSTNNSWLATLGATLDAATLLLTAVEDNVIGEADLYYWMGVSTIKAVAENFELPPSDRNTLTREDFEQALEFLRQAGYSVRDGEKSWLPFSARRSGYMRHLLPLSEKFESPAHVWLPTFKTATVTSPTSAAQAK